MKLSRVRAFALALTVICLPSLALAQSNVASLRGRVTDPSGAVVRSASVRLANPIARYEQVVKTDDEGEFRLVDVPPNTYTLSVESAGFETTLEFAPGGVAQLLAALLGGVQIFRETIEVHLARGLERGFFLFLVELF